MALDSYQIEPELMAADYIKITRELNHGFLFSAHAVQVRLVSVRSSLIKLGMKKKKVE